MIPPCLIGLPMLMVLGLIAIWSPRLANKLKYKLKAIRKRKEIKKNEAYLKSMIEMKAGIGERSEGMK